MNNKLPLPSLDQRRAAYAWEKVQGCGGEYMKLAKGAPALIMNNGLMQTLAFYHDKKGNHHKALNQHIIDWLESYLTGQQVSDFPFKTFMESLQNTDSQKYRKATEETLALLRWIRQFAAINQ